MFRGSIPALVTPFRDESFDEAEFRALVDWQIEQGSSALVPCGTTGESATMSIEERVRPAAEQLGGAELLARIDPARCEAEQQSAASTARGAAASLVERSLA